MNAPRPSLPDIQSQSPDIPLALSGAGIKDLRIRALAPESGGGTQAVTAVCSLGAALSASRRGAHMSRFVEAINAWSGRLDKDSVAGLLRGLRDRMDSDSVSASFQFPFFMRKASPSGVAADMAYQCGLKAVLDSGGMLMSIFLEAPVMTVCPCSLAISEEGAHSQRALIRLRLDMAAFPGFERFIRLAEASASSGVYTLLKREDEKRVTERAFASPAFVEDAARKAAFLLQREKDVIRFEAEVESMESIHNHSAFAAISGPGGFRPPK